MLRRKPTLALVLLALTLAAASALAAGPPPRYILEVLPAVTVDGDEAPFVLGRDLSDTGFVTGNAGAHAFLYTDDGRILTIDVGGGIGWRVNNLGQAYVESFSPGGHFLYSEANGAISLRASLPEAQQGGSLFVLDLNNNGTLVAYAKKTPMIFSPELGWRNGRELHPALADGEVTVEALNDRGDLVFRRGLGREPGSRFNRIENMVLQPSGELRSFGTEGPLILQVSRPNEAGQIVGAMVDLEEPLQAFAWTPRNGVVPIEIEGALETIGNWTPLRNVVGGGARFDEATKGLDSLFVHSLAAGGPSFVIPRQKFKRLTKRAGLKKFSGVQAFELNERLEFIGETLAKKRGRVPFVYRPDAGLFSLQRVVDASGGDFKVVDVIDLNRNGQILIGGRTAGGRSTSAVLTPVE